MKDPSKIPQLLLRCVLGITFLTPVSDRLGILGLKGTGNVECGNAEFYQLYVYAGASLLWQLFREGILFNRGFFLNLKDFRTQPLKVA